MNERNVYFVLGLAVMLVEGVVTWVWHDVFRASHSLNSLYLDGLFGESGRVFIWHWLILLYLLGIDMRRHRYGRCIPFFFGIVLSYVLSIAYMLRTLDQT